MNTPESLKYDIFGIGCDLSSVDNFILEEDENYEICNGCGQENCDCEKVFDRIFAKILF